MVSGLALLVSLVPALCPQGPAGDEAPPNGLTIVVVNVGQGDGLILKTPDGRVHVFDGGPDGLGSAAMNPAIAALAPSGYGLAFLSHWHIDHQGGLDEVLAAHPFTDVYDRGDVNRPSYSQTTDYLNAAGSRRRSVLPGQILNLGGGAVATVISVNGQVKGGTNIPVVGTAQEENSRSLVVRVDYGKFSIWLGGDLTGGGGGTADVETAATLACGNVDVYHVNHHGSSTSTAASLVANLAPELAVVSCGAANAFGHPNPTSINRINAAAAARVMLSTTEGTGMVGFGVAGTITITTDGVRYRATAQGGRFLDFYCDELTTPQPQPGELRISELMRQPAAGVGDALGEYLEITNVGARPLALKNLQVQSTSGVFTFVTNLVALPGRPLVLQGHGFSGGNGGLPLGPVFPYQALGTSGAFGNAADTVALKVGATTIDTLTYASGFPGGAGVAAERQNLLVAATSATFASAATSYGTGGKGTPGTRNPGDASAYGAGLTVEVTPNAVEFHAAHLAQGGKISVVALAFTSAPGFSLWGVPIPLNPDLLFSTFLSVPGYAIPLAAEGYRSIELAIPAPNPLKGYQAFAAHILIDALTPAITGVSTAAGFVFP